MIPADSPLPFGEAHPTQHAMLIVWGYFARTIGLFDQASWYSCQEPSTRYDGSNRYWGE